MVFRISRCRINFNGNFSKSRKKELSVFATRFFRDNLENHLIDNIYDVKYIYFHFEKRDNLNDERLFIKFEMNSRFRVKKMVSIFRLVFSESSVSIELLTGSSSKFSFCFDSSLELILNKILEIYREIPDKIFTIEDNFFIIVKINNKVEELFQEICQALDKYSKTRPKLNQSD